jgi:hypothetical protein
VAFPRVEKYLNGVELYQKLILLIYLSKRRGSLRVVDFVDVSLAGEGLRFLSENILKI